MRTLFITGATGAIGSALVGTLLDETDTQLRLLIRAKSPSDLNARMESLFRFLQVAPSDMAKRSRIRALCGDATVRSLGLDAATSADLCAQTTHIVHSAGAVRMNLPIDAARLSAVGSARNIVELAAACPRLQKIEFVSTVGVGGCRRGTLPEGWIEGPRTFHNTYEQAKAEAEDFVRTEVERGLPLTVHRPSMVVGASGTGAILHFQVFYHLCEFLSGRRTLGLCPNLGHARLDTVPADYVARAIAWSTRQPAAVGRVLQLCSGPADSVVLSELQVAVRRLFSEAGLWLPPKIQLSSNAFRVAMGALSNFAGAKARRAIGTLPVFLAYLNAEQAFGNERTQKMLAAAGLPLPMAQSYLLQVLRFYLASTRGKRNADL